MIFIVTGMCVLAVFGVNGECEPKCGEIPRHYQELGCNPITESGSGCPVRFECKPIADDKCEHNAKSYAIDENLPEEDHPECLAACRCIKSYSSGKARIQCASVECPQDLGVSEPNCIYVHSPGQCCGEPICNETEIASYKANVCHLEGREYHEGQQMYPKDDDAICICAKAFNNATIANNPHCRSVNCNIPIHYSDRLREGCAPVYYGKATGCPIDWVCPTDADVIADKAKSKIQSTPATECKFGKLAMGLGDQLKTAKSCVICTCSAPPMLHCIQKKSC